MKIRLGSIQTRPVFGRVEENLGKAIKLLKAIKADLIVLPELFNTGYFFTSKEELEEFAEDCKNGPSVKALIDMAKAKNAFIVAGIAEKEEGKYYNSSIFLTPEGEVKVYRKAHLFYKEKICLFKRE